MRMFGWFTSRGPGIGVSTRLTPFGGKSHADGCAEGCMVGCCGTLLCVALVVLVLLATGWVQAYG